MRQQDCKLDTNVSKTIEHMTLWKNENSIVDITKDTLAIKILLDNKPAGYIFHGNGRLLLDAIVETMRGAVGEPVERTLETFLMLGELETAQLHLQDAGQEDLTRLGYENQQEFTEKAQHLLDMLLERSTCGHGHSMRFHGDGGYVFALPNRKGTLDLLVAKDSSLVYKSAQTVFVKKGEKVVLKSHGRVAVSKPGKSIFLRRDYCSNVHKGIDSHNPIS